ncbi:alanine racemase [Gayadomonas joobiniege]|uniref:alanine racemase n=1 Tax=Gayadomonas joobiniege TaxID=1234606 RepID=UPI000381801D|nr:alanine racemase [Gayadomonas joobiniege]
MARFAQAEINLAAIRHNYLLAKQWANGARTLATVKANAYGHGAVAVATALADIADAFAVACIEEAIELRQAGIQSPILLLEGFFEASELALIDRYRLWTVVHEYWQLNLLADSRFKQPVNVWLKLDTGMHRLGFMPNEYHHVYKQLKCLPQVAEIVHMSHFAAAEDQLNPVTSQQNECFNNTILGLSGAISQANSAAIMRGLVRSQDWARPGIMLYGVSPNEAFSESTRLQTTMTLSGKIIAERKLGAGEGVGYNHIFVAPSEMRVGTVSMGYADGYPRAAGNLCQAYTDNQYCNILGRVSMDMLAIDLTGCQQPNMCGAKVELWGPNVPITQVADAAGTIAYELFCGLNRRVKRVYSGYDRSD